MKRMPTNFAWLAASTIVFGALLAQAPDTGSDDQTILKKIGLGTDGKSLLDYLRKQTYPEADPKLLDDLIRQLGDNNFNAREEAYGKLIGLGKAAIVGLKKADNDKDHEIRLRVKDLRNKLEAKVEPSIQGAAARLVASMKPEGAAEVLLAFVPHAADLSVTDEVCKALGAVAVTDKGPDPVVVKALTDKVAIKRAAAGEALARAKAAEHLPEVRKLLKDPEPIVRVRTGVALVNTRDSSAIADALPALIECLKHLPPENLWAAEDLLIHLADDKAPSVSLGTTEKTQELAYQAWETWYEKNRKDIALSKLDPTEPSLGNTLIVFQSMKGLPVAIAAGRVPRGPLSCEIVEVDINKKVLWRLSIEDSYPVDAMVMPDNPNEVLVAEYNKQRVSIREIKTNKVIWEHSLAANPISVQALPKGMILVTMQNRIVEVNRGAKTEKTLVNSVRPNEAIFRAVKTKNGDLVYVTNQGSLNRLNSKGAIVKQFQVAPIAVAFGNFDVLPNGNVLIPDYQNSRVVEYDTSGNQVNQTLTSQPNSAKRLPNGNTLVGSLSSHRVSEVNRAGQVVWSYGAEGQVFSARRR
jgi:hypothetical protein